MLIKTIKNPRDILIMSDDEFEQAVTKSDYLSLADIVFYMDVLSRAYQRMGRGTGDRTELEMCIRDRGYRVKQYYEIGSQHTKNLETKD